MEGGFCANRFLLTAFIILLTLTFNLPSSSAVGTVDQKTSTEFIRTSCSATTYPELCFSSLSTHTSLIQTSPQLLAHTALSAALNDTRFTSNMMLKLSKTHGLTPREVVAMRDCVEEISDSVDQLRKSVGEMSQLKSSNFGLVMSDVQTWVSAALTNENTCTEGFSGKAANGNVKNLVRIRLVKIAHMTSNALALTNSFASLHG